MKNRLPKSSLKNSHRTSMSGTLLEVSLATLTGKIQWTWFFGLVGGIILTAGKLLGIRYITGVDIADGVMGQLPNQKLGDTKFITLLKYVLPKEFQEEWLGDLQEKRSQLIKSRASRWKVFFFTLIASFGLVQFYFWLESRKIISRWTTKLKQLLLAFLVARRQIYLDVTDDGTDTVVKFQKGKIPKKEHR